jgi:hypothetical protein
MYVCMHVRTNTLNSNFWDCLRKSKLNHYQKCGTFCVRNPNQRYYA